MSKLILLLFVLFFILLFPGKALAALYINEFSSGTTSDWVEIYNSGLDSVDLSLYILRDFTNSDANKKELFGTIDSGAFTSIDWSNKLNKDGDIIRLLIKLDESEIDKVAYGDKGNDAPKPDSSQTAGRSPDGSSTWVILSESSKGASNNSSSAVPTPEPTPTDEPTPTKTPTPSKTPTPIKTPTPTKKPTSTPTPSTSSGQAKKLSEKEANSEDLFIAGENKISLDKSPTPEAGKPQVLGEKTSRQPFIFIGLGVIFLAVCGIFAYLQFGDKIFPRFLKKSEE